MNQQLVPFNCPFKPGGSLLKTKQDGKVTNYQLHLSVLLPEGWRLLPDVQRLDSVEGKPTVLRFTTCPPEGQQHEGPRIASAVFHGGGSLVSYLLPLKEVVGDALALEVYLHPKVERLEFDLELDGVKLSNQPFQRLLFPAILNNGTPSLNKAGGELLARTTLATQGVDMDATMDEHEILAMLMTEPSSGEGGIDVDNDLGGPETRSSSEGGTDVDNDLGGPETRSLGEGGTDVDNDLGGPETRSLGEGGTDVDNDLGGPETRSLGEGGTDVDNDLGGPETRSVGEGGTDIDNDLGGPETRSLGEGGTDIDNDLGGPETRSVGEGGTDIDNDLGGPETRVFDESRNISVLKLSIVYRKAS